MLTNGSTQNFAANGDLSLFVLVVVLVLKEVQIRTRQTLRKRARGNQMQLASLLMNQKMPEVHKLFSQGKVSALWQFLTLTYLDILDHTRTQEFHVNLQI